MLASLSAGCAAQKPVLYPNTAVERDGWPAAEAAVDACMRRAEEFVSSGNTQGAARDATTGAVLGAGSGAAIGAAGGAVSGGAGRGAAIGAATGGTAGFLHAIFGRARRPDPVYVNFVERCLREKGYEPIGWK